MPTDYIVIGVILGLLAAMLCAHYDGWFHPERYKHLELKEENKRVHKSH